MHDFWSVVWPVLVLERNTCNLASKEVGRDDIFIALKLHETIIPYSVPGNSVHCLVIPHKGLRERLTRHPSSHIL